MRGLNGIPREELEAVFDRWLKRLDGFIQRRREYAE
jgi:hypothetical protein